MESEDIEGSRRVRLRENRVNPIRSSGGGSECQTVPRRIFVVAYAPRQHATRMGLDATVYCDCFEKGRLRSSPPLHVSLYVDASGALECASEHLSLEDQISLDRWLHFASCEHEDRILLHHYLSNIARVGILRTEFQREPDRFPVLLKKVIYCGIHAGDFLSVETIPVLVQELDSLSAFQGSNPRAAEILV